MQPWDPSPALQENKQDGLAGEGRQKHQKFKVIWCCLELKANQTGHVDPPTGKLGEETRQTTAGTVLA